MRLLARAIDGFELPAVEKIAESQQQDPFQVLIGTLLSARTQDATTLAASTRLFKVADNPDAMARLSTSRIERLIYPVSFYRHKARHVKATCQLLVNRFGGRVPTTMEDLFLRIVEESKKHPGRRYLPAAERPSRTPAVDGQSAPREMAGSSASKESKPVK